MEAFDPLAWDGTAIRAQAERFSPQAFRGRLARWILDEVEWRC
jgi:hypothetical protein